MKISNSKKQLAQLLIEAGVTQFPDGANWAAQDSDRDVDFFEMKPVRDEEWWQGDYDVADRVSLSVKIPNWHQTILSREEYFHLYPAPDADGWIEWKGGECPVAEGTPIAIRHRDGEEFHEAFALGNWNARWEHEGLVGDVVAYRLRIAEQEKSTAAGDADTDLACKEVQVLAVEAKPAIEQLAADYRNKLDYANRKQDEADKANMESDAALSQLEDAIAAIGFVITPLAATEKEPELVITDWRDLQVGDEVEAKCHAGTRIGIITELESVGYEGCRPFRFKPFGDTPIWCTSREFKFIRRP